MLYTQIRFLAHCFENGGAQSESVVDARDRNRALEVTADRQADARAGADCRGSLVGNFPQTFFLASNPPRAHLSKVSCDKHTATYIVFQGSIFSENKCVKKFYDWIASSKEKEK
jgi:hypothetical protein